MSEHISDRMPLVALGRRAWTAGEEAHLAGCPECAAEWRVVSAASRIGAQVEAELDVEAVAAGVVARLPARGTAPRPILRRVRPVVLALAAALFLAVVLGLPDGRRGEEGGEGAQVTLLPELEDLAADELELMFEVLPAAAPVGVTGPVGLGDLTEEELESVLRTLEG